MENYFAFVCKSDNGVIYLSTVLCESCKLQSALERYSALGVTVLDVKVVSVNLSDYEHA